MAHTSPLVIILLELRRTIRTLILTTFGLTLAIFILSPRLLDIVQSHLAEKLYFFSVVEPFFPMSNCLCLPRSMFCCHGLQAFLDGDRQAIQRT